MRTVLLIRHGESLSNAGLPTSSAQNIPLTELGEEQAQCIAKYLESQLPLDLIVTSSYQRAKQTALPAILSFPFIPQEEWPVHEFTFLSLNFNKSSTADERRPFVEKYWETSDPSYIHGSGAESFKHFIKRTRRVLEYIKCINKNIITIFSHMQFICALLWLSQQDSVKLSPQTMQEFKDFLDANLLSNGAIVRVQFEDSNELWRYEIITSHLNDPENLGKHEEPELVAPKH